MADMVSIVNTIIQNGSTELSSVIPTATVDNIRAIADPIINYELVANEFFTTLFNKVGMQMIKNKTFKNPLAVLKKGGLPLGSQVQEIITNLTKGEQYDPTGAGVFSYKKPDVKTVYHSLDRKQDYPFSLNEDLIEHAFTSWGAFEELLNTFVTTMYSSDNRDEYVLMKDLFATAVTGGKVLTAESPIVTDEASGKSFVKSVRNASTYMTYPSSNFNKYWANKATSDNGSALETWCEKKDQILIARADVMTEIDVEVLAQAFNMDKTNLMGNVLEVDNFGSATNCKAILADKAWVQVYDRKLKLTNQYNGHGLFMNYWLHHWQIYSVLLLANAVAFIDPVVVP
jgi:hypothetical protein